MTLPEHTRQPLGPNQERWIKALESGEYSQTKGHLRDGESYCCLGVGCVLLGIRGEYNEVANLYWFDGEAFVAPEGVRDGLALRGGIGASRKGSQKLALSELNDSGATFKQIAAIIRSDPSVYFKEPR